MFYSPLKEFIETQQKYWNIYGIMKHDILAAAFILNIHSDQRPIEKKVNKILGSLKVY